LDLHRSLGMDSSIYLSFDANNTFGSFFSLAKHPVRVLRKAEKRPKK
jgi:hypothetical protein